MCLKILIELFSQVSKLCLKILIESFSQVPKFDTQVSKQVEPPFKKNPQIIKVIEVPPKKSPPSDTKSVPPQYVTNSGQHEPKVHLPRSNKEKSSVTKTQEVKQTLKSQKANREYAKREKAMRKMRHVQHARFSKLFKPVVSRVQNEVLNSTVLKRTLASS